MNYKVPSRIISLVRKFGFNGSEEPSHNEIIEWINLKGVMISIDAVKSDFDKNCLSYTVRAFTNWQSRIQSIMDDITNEHPPHSLEGCKFRSWTDAINAAIENAIILHKDKFNEVS